MQVQEECEFCRAIVLVPTAMPDNWLLNDQRIILIHSLYVYLVVLRHLVFVLRTV